MPRIRTIKPEFYHNEELSSLPAETHLFAGALINQADDEGYFHAHAGLLKAAIFPLRECSLSTHEMLTQLASIGFIRLGSTADGKKWGHILTFLDHQKINRPSKSKIKTYEISWENSVNTHGALTDDSLGKGRKERKERKGKELKPSSTCVDGQTKESTNPVTEKEIKSTVGRLFSFYCLKLNRSPNRYSLTDKRRDMAIRRLTERLKFHNGDLEAVERESETAITNLSESEFHQANGYVEWDEQIFCSQEMYEKRLNWKQKGKNNGQSKDTERSSRTVTSLGAFLGDSTDTLSDIGDVQSGDIRSASGILGDGLKRLEARTIDAESTGVHKKQ